MITPLFHGKNIVPAGNVNSAQVDVPKLNDAMDKAGRSSTRPSAPRRGPISTRS